MYFALGFGKPHKAGWLDFLVEMGGAMQQLNRAMLEKPEAEITFRGGLIYHLMDGQIIGTQDAELTPDDISRAARWVLKG